MQLLTEAAGFAVLALLLRNRPGILAIICLALWIAIPHVVLDPLATGKVYHPATVLAVVSAGVTALFRSRLWAQHVLENIYIHLALAAFLGIAILAAIAFANTALLIEQVIAPLCVWGLVRIELRQSWWYLSVAVWAIQILAIGESVLALVQQSVHLLIPFDQAYRINYWYIPGWNRYNGTLDHPLVLGVFLVLATWLLAYIPSMLLRLSIATLYVFAVLATESRTALILIAAGIVALVLASRMRIFTRFFAFAAAAIAAVLAWPFFLKSTVFQRFLEDNGSADARGTAAQIFADRAGDFFFFGAGINASNSLVAKWGAYTTFENPFLAYSVDYGIIGASLYFGVQAALIARAVAFTRRNWFTILAAIAVIIAIQSFSSLEAQTACGIILWFSLGLVAEKNDARRTTSHANLADTQGEEPRPIGAAHG